MEKARNQDQPVQAPEPKDEARLNEVLYDRFVEKSRNLFEQSKEKGAETWDKAMELARQQMTAAGEFTAEQGNNFKRYLSRDLRQTMTEMNQLGKETKVRLHPARLGAGALASLAKLFHISGGWLTFLSEKTEKALAYQSGEITMAGTLTCSGCGNKIHLNRTSVVPVCPSCQGTSFHKGY